MRLKDNLDNTILPREWSGKNNFEHSFSLRATRSLGKCWRYNSNTALNFMSVIPIRVVVLTKT